MSDIIPEGILYGNLGVGSGTTNYNDLDNKPQINSVTLQGNKTASDLGLVGTSDIPVTSVNGETGAVVLDGTEIEFSTGVSINEKILAVEQEIPVIAYPVTSVNGETGAVVLDGTEINYQAGKTINQKIDEVEAEIPVVSYPVTSVNSKTGVVVLDGTDIEYSSGVSVNSQIDTLMNYIPVYGNTASGAIATFDTSLALPLQDCTIAINAVQESGTPTPSSPKLISGFTGANVVSVSDYASYFKGVYDGTYGFVDLSTLTWSSVSRTGFDLWTTTGLSSLAKAPTSNSNPFNGISSEYTISDYNTVNGTNTPNAIALRINGTMYLNNGSSVTPPSGYLIYELATPTTPSITTAQFNTLKTAFNIGGSVVNVTWQTEAGTIYGGSLDVTTGVLTVNNYAVDMGALTYTSPTTGVLQVTKTVIQTVTGYEPKRTNTSFCACEIFELANNTNDFRFYSNEDPNDAPTTFNGYKIVYELATPIIYQLTPTQINAIVAGGAKTTNNVFTDTNGDTSVVYACSLKDYIEGQ